MKVLLVGGEEKPNGELLLVMATGVPMAADVEKVTKIVAIAPPEAYVSEEMYPICVVPGRFRQVIPTDGYP